MPTETVKNNRARFQAPGAATIEDRYSQVDGKGKTATELKSEPHASHHYGSLRSRAPGSAGILAADGKPNNADKNVGAPKMGSTPD